MAAPKKSRSQGYPGRALAVILLAVVALAAGMVISGNTTPRLGIDLAGGTSITLTAKSEPGQQNAINKTNLNTAVNIIERRVNGVGVTEAEVQTQGDRNIIVNIPKGTNEKQAEEQVGRTARLFFRPVLAQAQVAPPPAPSSSPSASPSASSSGSATPKGSASASPSQGGSSSPAGGPSASPTSQGRVLSEGLTKVSAAGQQAPRAVAAPSTTPTGSAAPTAAPPSAPPAGPAPSAPPAPNPAGALPPDLQQKFTTENCKRKLPEGKPKDTVIACGQEDGLKYILGPVAVDGTDLDDASAFLDQQRGSGWQVNLDFTGGGTKKFADVTGKLAAQQPPNNQFAIVLDGEVVSAPSVSNAIGGGQAQITGSFTQQEAEDLANVLSYGALPLTFEKSDVTTVSAALGGDQLRGGLIAGAIGMVLVIVYSLAYYRGLALVSVLSLAVSAALTYAIMTMLGPGIGFALNLPAVCGAIVAIGITADSFIVYFERIRDEIRDGRTLRPAVERGWPRARRTILVSDFVSFLAAAVLYIVSVGKVQGFAFTLGLTTVLDVVVVFLFTKPLMTILARTRFYGQGHRWSGLDPKRLGARPAPIRGRRRPATEVKEA